MGVVNSAYCSSTNDFFVVNPKTMFWDLCRVHIFEIGRFEGE